MTEITRYHVDREDEGELYAHDTGAVVKYEDHAAVVATLRAQLAGVRERATPDVVRILRLLSDEKSRPITLHIGYGQQLAAMADALAALDGAA